MIDDEVFHLPSRDDDSDIQAYVLYPQAYVAKLLTRSNFGLN